MYNTFLASTYFLIRVYIDKSCLVIWIIWRASWQSLHMQWSKYSMLPWYEVRNAKVTDETGLSISGLMLTVQFIFKQKLFIWSPFQTFWSLVKIRHRPQNFAGNQYTWAAKSCTTVINHCLWTEEAFNAYMLQPLWYSGVKCKVRIGYHHIGENSV